MMKKKRNTHAKFGSLLLVTPQNSVSHKTSQLTSVKDKSNKENQAISDNVMLDPPVTHHNHVHDRKMILGEMGSNRSRQGSLSRLLISHLPTKTNQDVLCSAIVIFTGSPGGLLFV